MQNDNKKYRALHVNQLFDFPSGMHEVHHIPCDAFDITSSYFVGKMFKNMIQALVDPG